MKRWSVWLQRLSHEAGNQQGSDLLDRKRSQALPELQLNQALRIFLLFHLNRKPVFNTTINI
ncbi:hypothetical protein EcB171_5045 [Escherichia coli B171]|nr:hypothetical protein EcB171_5045 [Escherichia coli B171]